MVSIKKYGLPLIISCMSLVVSKDTSSNEKINHPTLDSITTKEVIVLKKKLSDIKYNKAFDTLKLPTEIGLQIYYEHDTSARLDGHQTFLLYKDIRRITKHTMVKHNDSTVSLNKKINENLFLYDVAEKYGIRGVTISLE